MTFAIDAKFLDTTEHDARDHSVVPGVLTATQAGLFGGDGSLGNVTISSNTNVTGVRNYNDLTILTAVVLAATTGALLHIKCAGDLDIQGTGILSASGRGGLGGAGGAGSDGDEAGASVAGTIGSVGVSAGGVLGSVAA